ncbi:MAG: heme/hemin ABC transporter substrate-binding protein [Enterobacteriaceae bacterium]
MTAKRFSPLLFILSLMLATASEAQRLITAGPNITEIVLALGAGQQIVGVDNSSILPEGSSAARLGYIRQLPAEGMLALQPDRILGSSEMGPAVVIDQIRKAGVPVSEFAEEGGSADLLANIGQIAQLLERSKEGNKLQQQVKQQLAQLQQDAQPSAEAPRVVFLLLNEGAPLMVAGKGSVADELITLAGGINPAHKLRNYQTLSVESLLSLQPQVILLGTRHGNQAGQQLRHRYPQLAATTAGRLQAIYQINSKALLGGVGLTTLDEARRLQALLQKVPAEL